MGTMKFSKPNAANDFLAEHIARLQASLKHRTRQELIVSHPSPEEQAVTSHALILKPNCELCARFRYEKKLTLRRH